MEAALIETPAVVPELDVEDLQVSLAFYVGVLGFIIAVERTEEAFAYLMRGNVHLMLEQAAGPGRRFRTAPLEKPFGRGMNLQMQVNDIGELWRAVADAEANVIVELEERWYRQGSFERGNLQFVVADPDGYLLRPFQDLGARKCGALG